MRHIVNVLAIILLSLSSSTGEIFSTDTPTKGSWQGLPLGTWVVYKYTFYSEGNKNKIEYVKHLLYGTDRNGNGRYCVYESHIPRGKWKKSNRGGVGTSCSIDINSINNDSEAKELIKMEDSTISCYAIINKSERWDELSVTKRWVAANTGIFIKTRVITTPRFDDAKFTSKKWSLDTNWRKQIKLQDKDISLYSQTMRTTQDNNTWHVTEQTLSPDVPGWQVRRKEIRTATMNEQVEFELELIEWGEDQTLLKQYLENKSGSDPQIKKSNKRQQDFFRETCIKTIKQLSSENDTERLHASQYLAQNLYLKDNELIKDIMKGLLPCLSDSVIEIQRNTATALGNLNGREAIPKIEKLLRDDKGGTWYYIQALVKLKAPLIIEDILHAMKYEDPYSRMAAVQALKGRNIEPIIFSKLIELSQDDHYAVRREVYEVIGASKPTNSTDIILRGMDDTNKYVQIAAYEAAGKVGGAAVTKKLIDCLSIDDKNVNSYALRALISKKPLSKDAINAISRLIENSDKDIQVKVHAISLLGKYKRNEAVPALISIIRGDTGFNIFNRTRTDVIAAIRALGMINDKSAVPVLLEFISDSRIGNYAVSALTELGDPRAANPLLVLYKNTSVDDDNAKILLKGIRSCGNKDFTVILTSYFNSCPPARRQEVWSAIEKINRRQKESSGHN